jgi:hypothetical protein
MALVVNLSVGRLLARNERLTTAKMNAVVKSIVIDISGSVGNADLAAASLTYDKAVCGPWFYAAATFDGASTYTAAYSPVISAYVDGTVLAFKAGSQNLGATLFNAGAGALPLRKHGGQVELAPGDLVANGIYEVRYNSTLTGGGCFELLSLPARPVETTPWQPASAFLAGQEGVMPAFPAGAQTKYLRGDGTFQDPVAQAVAQAAVQNQNTVTEIVKAQNFI